MKSLSIVARVVVAIQMICGIACAQTQPATTQPAVVHAAMSGRSHEYLLHLPGIGGWMRIDTYMTGGLRDGGIAGEIDIYDWTGGNPGLPALGGYDRNREEAQKVAAMIRDRLKDDPSATITLTGHSAGAGIAVWALEDLPDDTMIDTLVMLAPALSPNYDLTRALRHVRRAFTFISDRDPILGAGTRAFGTVDRVKTDAAGRVGFATPDSAEAREEYTKLTTFAYDRDWIRFGNLGDHIGAMMRPFARRMIAPLLLTGELPVVSRQPATTQSTR